MRAAAHARRLRRFRAAFPRLLTRSSSQSNNLLSRLFDSSKERFLQWSLRARKWAARRVSLAHVRGTRFEPLEARMLLAATYTVDILDDVDNGNFAPGDLSLREAITLANSNPGADVIEFNTVFTNGPGLHTINLTSPLPSINETVFLDGSSQPGYQGKPLINIDGNLISGTILTINNSTADGTEVEGVKLSGFTGTGIQVSNADQVRLEDLDLSEPGNYGQSGIVVSSSNDVVITGVNTTGMSSQGIQVTSSNNPMIQDNTLDRTGSIALYLNNVSGIGLGAISGNTFAGSSNGLRIDNGMSGLVIGDASVAGAHIVIEDATSGMDSVRSTAIYLGNVDNATIDNVEVAYDDVVGAEGKPRSGYGILAQSGSDNLTVKNISAANRSNGIYVNGGQDLTLTDNDLANNSQAIYVNNVTKDGAAAAIIASGNVFTSSADALEIRSLTGASAGLTIGPAMTNHIVLGAAARLETVTGNVLHLNNVDDVIIDGLDVSYESPSRSGIGILGDGSSDNWTIQNVASTNRSTGIQVTGGGTDLTLTGNDLSNNNTALYLTSLTDGGDADSLPIRVSGTKFTGSNNAFN